MEPTPPTFPPATFHLSDFVFRPHQPYVPRPRLLETTEALVNQRRYVSALEPLLAIMAESPQDQEALTLALMVVGRARTQQVQADEALSQRYLLDRRLDPIFAVCSQCQRSSWAPVNCLIGDAAQVSNPIGVQCRSCGYVVCRNCIKGASGQCCPNCGAFALRSPVYPTGRHSHQLERRGRPVAVAVIMREGPIAPDAEWTNDLLSLLSPDVLESAAQISCHALYPWRSDADRLARAIAAMLTNDNKAGGATLDGMLGAEVKGTDGIRAYILKLYRP